MASGTGLAAALAALKAHAAAAVVIGTVVVGSGAVAAVATGAVQLPGASTHQQSPHGDSTETASGTESAHTAAACAASGDSQRLADAFAPMFDSKASAQQSICTLFVGTDGHTLGFGEVQQVLEITAAIEQNGGATACLAGADAHGQGTPATKGKPEGTPGAQGGQPSITVPTSTTATTMSLAKQVLDAAQHGTPLASLAKSCGAGHVTGNPGSGSTGRPTETPGAKPTGTPGHP